MRKYVGNMKIYMENKKDSPCIRAMGLGIILSSSPYLWARPRGGVAISSLGVPQRKNMKRVKNQAPLIQTFGSVIWENTALNSKFFYRKLYLSDMAIHGFKKAALHSLLYGSNSKKAIIQQLAHEMKRRLTWIT